MPVFANRRFWFGDLTWEIPNYENAEVFVDRLARAGIVVRSHATDAAVEGDVDWMSQRSLQRHFRRVTGMTFSRRGSSPGERRHSARHEPTARPSRCANVMV